MKNTPASNPKELYQLIQLVRPLYKTLEASVALELSETGISVSQRAVLEQLLEQGALTVPAIGRALVWPRQYAQTTANKLLARRLISKHENRAHKRSPLLELTSEGRSLIVKIRSREAEVMEPIAGLLSSRDIETAKEVMAQMIRAFDAHNRT